MVNREKNIAQWYIQDWYIKSKTIMYIQHFVAMCITVFFVHGFLPSSLLSVVLVPIIKDKCSKINSKDNYRPIALASIVSKKIENIVRQNVSYAVNNVQSVWI